MRTLPGLLVATMPPNRLDLEYFHPPPDLIARIHGPLTVIGFMNELARLHANGIAHILVYDAVPLNALLPDIANFFRQICPRLADPCIIQFNVPADPDNRRSRSGYSMNVGTGGISQYQAEGACPKIRLRSVR
jgi:hypothetical protein